MPTFRYQAIEAGSGRERAGVVEGATVEAAVRALKARGLAPVAVHDGGRTSKSDADARRRTVFGAGFLRRELRWGRPVRTSQLAVFTRQLATLLRAGLPLVRALDVLGRQEKNEQFRDLIADIAGVVRGGARFSDGLQRHTRVFDRLYVNMAKAGEEAGVLAAVMDRVAVFLEKSERTKGRIKAAMTYPLVVMLLAVTIVAALMVWVVPRFEQIFAGLLRGQPLPALTQGVIGLSRSVQQHGWLWAGSIALVIGALVAWRKTSAGQRLCDVAVLRAPLIGDLVLKGAVARFARTFGTLLSSGVPILQALTMSRDTCGNTRLAEALEFVRQRVKEGDGVARPLAAVNVFPSMLSSMVEVGEETGALAEMLGRVADAYEEEVDRSVAGLTSLLEPLMIVFLAGVVGTIVIALFLPIVSILQYLQ